MKRNAQSPLHVRTKLDALEHKYRVLEVQYHEAIILKRSKTKLKQMQREFMKAFMEFADLAEKLFLNGYLK